MARVLCACFLSWSHGEGFVRVFRERMSAQGFYLMDEPESALSPKRQLDLLRLLAEVQQTARAQVILATHSPLLMAVPGARLLEVTRFGFLATHSPLLMAVPGARLLEVTRFGFQERRFSDTAHFKLYRAFASDPEGFIRSALQDPGALP